MTHLIRNFIYTYLNMIPHSPSPTPRYQTRPLAKFSLRKEGMFGMTGYLFWGILRFGNQTQSPRAVHGHQPNFFVICTCLCMYIYLREMGILPKMYFLCPRCLRNDRHPCRRKCCPRIQTRFVCHRGRECDRENLSPDSEWPF